MSEPLPASVYLHGTAPEEQQRLELLNLLLNERELAELRIAPGERILELGAGTGIFARAMARAGGRVIGVERSPAQLVTAARLSREAGEEALVELRQGDVYEPPLSPQEWSSFDLVHARFLLEHLADPARALRTMARAVRPGGRVVLADDDHPLLRLWPALDEFDELWRLYQLEYRRIGCEPEAGRHLVQQLAQAGLRPRRNGLVFFGGCAGDPLFPTVVENFAGVVRSARTGMLTSNAIDATRFDATLEAFLTWGRRDDAALWYALSWAEGVRA